MYSIITYFDKINNEKWRRFVDDHPYGNIFQLPDFYNVYENCSKQDSIIICCENNETNEVEGILLCAIYKEHKGFLGTFSSRAIIWGGPLVKDNNKDILHLLLNAYLNKIRKRVIYTEIRNFYDQSNNKEIFKLNRFKYFAHLNILLDLSIGEEMLWKNLKRQRKEGIRKAQRNNFIFKEENEAFKLSVFYDLLVSSYKKINLPFPAFDFFVKLNQFFNPLIVKYFTLSKDNEVIIALCALVYKKCIYAFYIGIADNKEVLNKRPVDLFYWELILYSCKQGIKTFDWLGAGKPEQESGVRKFKLEYGGELMELGRFMHIHKPFLMEFSSFILFTFGKVKRFLR